MFWSRVDLFKDLISKIAGEELEFEVVESMGDGTLAHAYERLFGLLPEITGSNIAAVKLLPIKDGVQENTILLDPQPSFIPTTETLKASEVSSLSTFSHEYDIQDMEQYILSNAELIEGDIFQKRADIHYKKIHLFKTISI